MVILNTILTTILLCTTISCAIILTIHIKKLSESTTDLANNTNRIVQNLEKEIEPTLKELQGAAKSINSIANNADTKFKDTKTNIASLIGVTACLGGKLKGFTQGIMKGISFGMGLFKK